MNPTEASIRLWFRGRAAGVILGAQSGPGPQNPKAWCPVLYVGHDGRLRADLGMGPPNPVTSAGRVDDGRWRHVTLVKGTDRQQLYIDGELAGEGVRPQPVSWATTLQLGTGFTAQWPEANGTWFPFSGDMRDAIIAPRAWDAKSIFSDYVQSSDGEASR